MLTSLRIQNFAIVKTLELTFRGGMTAFTGETGAGKSIMIDALMLALGERADASVIRPGQSVCDIQASFDFESNSAPACWLQEHDIDFEGNEVILRRLISKEGRSKCTINGVLFPLQKVKALSQMLVDIHGQHEHQSLLQPVTHRKQLDNFANHPQLLQNVSHCYQTCLAIQNQLNELEQAQINSERKELLAYQIEELTALNLEPGEIERLHQEHQTLHHANDYLAHTTALTQLLDEGDDFTLTHALNQALQLLAKLPTAFAPIQTATELLNQALIQSDEAVAEIRRFASQVTLDPERLAVVEARMSLLHQMARKYQVNASELSDRLKHLEQEWTLINASSEHKVRLKAEFEAACASYQVAASALTDSRKMHALRLETAITATIQILGMPKGFLTVEITPQPQRQPHGLDKVEYLVCTNPGMNLEPLSKVASGGELSRISLAIQLITAERAQTPTLLFDEVDVGIGGTTAALVGQLLKKLGSRLQLFCVTHQPQVAASAHHHFVVEKQTDDKETFSFVRELLATDKIQEIARMLGGLKITQETLSHAKALLIETES